MSAPPPFSRPHLVGTYGSHFNRLIPLLENDRWLFGRDRQCDIVIEHADVSRKHAEIMSTPEGGWLLVDLGSANGTCVNGTRIERHRLQQGDRIRIFKNEYIYIDPSLPLPEPGPGPGPFRYIDETLAGQLLPVGPSLHDTPVRLEEQTTTIGSGAFNDIVISDETVSTNHCKIKNDDGEYLVVDLKSTNGTWVNGERIGTERVIYAGDEVEVGRLSFRFTFFRRPQEIIPVERESSFMTVLLVFLAMGAVLAGASFLALALATLLSDVPPVGPIKHLVLRSAWTAKLPAGTAPVAFDLDGDGTCEIFAAGPGRQASCLDGGDGSVLWQYRPPSPVESVSVLPRALGSPAFLLLCRQCCIALDMEGRSLWESPFGSFPGRPYPFVSTATDHEGRPLVAVGTGGCSVRLIDGDRGLPIAHTTPERTPRRTAPAFGATAGNRSVSVYTVDDEGCLVSYDLDCAPSWRSDGPFKCGCPPLAGDLDGDGSIELVLPSRDGRRLCVLEARRGRCLQRFEIPEGIGGPALCAQLSPAPGLEILLPLANGRLAGLRYGSRSRLWTSPELADPGDELTAAIHDMNRDGIDDSVAVSSSGTVYICDGRNGGVLAKRSCGGRVSGGPVLADVDGDGRVDIMVGLLDGSVEVISSNRPCTAGAAPWPVPAGIGGGGASWLRRNR